MTKAQVYLNIWMMRRRKVKKTPFLWVLLVFIGLGSARAQEDDVALRIARLDASNFPLVRLNLITADSRSAPIIDLSSLSVRENGTPIPDFAVKTVPVGVDVIFVIDASSSILQVDGNDDLTRYEKVQESITRFVTRFMSGQVTVVAPDEAYQNGRFLIEDDASSEAVIKAIGDYSPDPPANAPLHEMMKLAIEHATLRRDNGRFQAILLFTDGGQLDELLTFSTLVKQAQAINLPIFTAILGARADADEIENVSRLSQPTRAFHVHMPTAADSDPVYLIWQRQGNQAQIEYRSLQTDSGRYPISVNLGEAMAGAVLDLTIEPPRVTILLDETVIGRVGDAPDSPLASLEPASQPLSVAIRWPDGLPRRLTAVTLLVNGQPELSPGSLTPDADGLLAMAWDIQNLDAGTYELLAQATDELGLGAESEPLTVTIVVERPLPPTPTAAPTAVPETAEPAPLPLPQPQKTAILALDATGGAAALALLLRRRSRRRLTQARAPSSPDPSPAAPPIPVTAEGGTDMVAFLELAEDAPGNVTRIPIKGDNVTIGRDRNIAQIIFSDASVARLHARVKKSGDAYWLYDEGSASGTYRNFERLGLAPQQLHDQDTVGIGRVQLRFYLRPIDVDEEQS